MIDELQRPMPEVNRDERVVVVVSLGGLAQADEDEAGSALSGISNRQRAGS
jgi:hypothetical protein